MYILLRALSCAETVKGEGDTFNAELTGTPRMAKVKILFLREKFYGRLKEKKTT